MTEPQGRGGIAPDDERSVDWLKGALGLGADASAFPWQIELLRRFLRGQLVEAIDVPTGLGKTGVMAIWLVALASGAKVPRRLVYVVDRRAVVDQATDVAEGLRAWVQREAAAAQALNLGGRPLPISTLRGQHVDNREWLDHPSLPAIVVGTVDMIGSRLLFSGYGVTSKMRPYHAGLLGTDALIVLDEAHLSQPFERLIEQVAQGVDANGRSIGPERGLQHLVPRFRSLSLSATGRERDPERVLGLTEEDRRPGGTVDKRLRGPKNLGLLPQVRDEELPEALAAEAWKLSNDGTAAARVIVFCTSRDDAQEVREVLAKKTKAADLADPVLFVGGRRVYERQIAATRLRELGFVAGSGARPDKPTFVIATAAGEVGVDLDADHAVCDLVAWERMVQRLGRVNRRGEGDARIVVVPAKADDEAEAARRDAVLDLLAVLPKTGGEATDVSLAALTSLKERSRTDESLRGVVARATTPAPLHPPLTRALLESWSMTSLEEHTGRPEVAPWIRGWPDDEERPQTTLVWRRWLPIDDDGKLIGKRDLDVFRDAADPHLVERLETEAWRAVAWLEKRLKTLGRGLSQEVVAAEPPLQKTDVVGIVLDGFEPRPTIIRGDDLTGDIRKRVERALAGATLILDRRIGGLCDGLLDEESDDPVLDVTDVESETDPRVVPFRVRRIDEPPTEPAEGWRTEGVIPVRRSDEGESQWLVVESVVDAAAESEEGRSAARRAQLLTEHEEWTEQEARAIAALLSLPADYLEIVATAARLHDEGKKASRWQRAFRIPNGDPPFAKSATSRPNLALLEGYRHELGSLPYAEADARVKAMSPELRELCLHLIAAHHGSSRPLIRTAGADEPPTRLALRAREIALRFAALEKQWGPWGLAWWEALLRAADQRASRRNDREGGPRG